MKYFSKNKIKQEGFNFICQCINDLKLLENLNLEVMQNQINTLGQFSEAI